VWGGRKIGLALHSHVQSSVRFDRLRNQVDPILGLADVCLNEDGLATLLCDHLVRCRFLPLAYGPQVGANKQRTLVVELVAYFAPNALGRPCHDGNLVEQTWARHLEKVTRLG